MRGLREHQRLQLNVHDVARPVSGPGHVAVSSIKWRITVAKWGRLDPWPDRWKSQVELALAQFDEVGRAGFIQRYGFGFANTYLLSHDGHLYDPKAISGVAHSYTGTGDVLKPSDFDATEAIGRLRKLDFSVVNFNGLWWVNQGSTYDRSATERMSGLPS